MPGYFYCRHCGKRTRKNPRIKTSQSYCGCQSCQQSRKNLWEREKLENNPEYHNRRKKQKAHWREHRPGHQYQQLYRQRHPLYAEINRKKQIIRNKKASKIAFESHFQKIVKTDALISESLTGRGVYEILPWYTRLGEKECKDGRHTAAWGIGWFSYMDKIHLKKILNWNVLSLYPAIHMAYLKLRPRHTPPNAPFHIAG